MFTQIKVYVVVENFEKDYSFSDGYANSVFASRERALEACKVLSHGDRNYSCHIVETDLFIDLKSNGL